MGETACTRERPPGWRSPVAALARHRERLAGAPLPGVTTVAAPAPRWAVPAGPWHLLFDPGLGCELLEPRPVTPLPGAPPWLPGVVNLRGTLVPVFDPASLAERSAAGARLLAVGAGEEAAVLRVAGMPFTQDPAVLGTPLASLPALPEPLAAAAERAWQGDDGFWLACDLPALFRALGREAGRVEA